MKIKEFNEKVRIGSEVVYKGKVCKVSDIYRKTHEALLGRSELRIRCSEFELYTGGEVQPYVEEKEPPVKMGRPPKPVIAIFDDGRRIYYETTRKAAQELKVSSKTIQMVLGGKQKTARGIRFMR